MSPSRLFPVIPQRTRRKQQTHFEMKTSQRGQVARKGDIGVLEACDMAVVVAIGPPIPIFPTNYIMLKSIGPN